jgi:hypothetical protein
VKTASGSNKGSEQTRTIQSLQKGNPMVVLPGSFKLTFEQPIPLELLVITQMEEFAPKAGMAKRPSSSGSKPNPLNPTDFNAKERVNIESGKAENHFNLMQLNQQLIFRTGEHVDLKLTEEGRQLIFKGSLKSKGGGDIQCFLFDHALLLVRIKVVNKREQYIAYRKVILC